MNAEQKQLARLRAWVDNLPSEVTLIHGDPFAETPNGVLVLHRQADAVLGEFCIERGSDGRLWERLPSIAKARSLGVSDGTVIAMAESLHTARATIARLEGELAPVRTAQRMGSALVPVSPELLAEGAFTEQPLHVMLTDNGDGTHTITFRESEELRTLRTRADAAERRVEAVTALVAVMEQMAAKDYEHWDNDRDAKVGKILGALASHRPGYSLTLDAARQAVTEADAALAAASGDTATTEG